MFYFKTETGPESAFPLVRADLSVGLTGFEPATPCPPLDPFQTLRNLAHLVPDLHKHRPAPPTTSLELDQLCGLSAE